MAESVTTSGNGLKDEQDTKDTDSSDSESKSMTLETEDTKAKDSSDNIKEEEKEVKKETEKGKDKEKEKEKRKEKEKEEEDANFDLALAAERIKLKEKLEKHKEKLIWILGVCHAIDIVLASLLILPVNGKEETPTSWKWFLFHLILNPFYSFSRLFDTKHDTLDSGLIIVLRVVCLWKFVQLAIKWGHPDTHNKIQDSKKLKEEFEHSFMFKLGQFLTKIVETAVENSIDISQNSRKKNEILEKLEKERLNNGGDSGITRTFMDATDNDLIHTYSVAKVISNLKDYDAQDSADFWKSTIWVLLFTSVSIFQGYIGVKLVFFESSSLYYVSIYLINILISHFEIYYVKQYIDDCTEPDNKFIAESLHSHALFKRKVAGHWCDLCYGRIDSHAYRCAKCDFDVCPTCWKNKEKARLAAQNQIRNDNTKDNKSMAELDKAVTAYEYFARIFQLHLPYQKPFAFGLFILFIKSSIGVSLSSAKGNLFDNIIDKNINAFYHGIQMYVILTIVNGVLNTLQSFLLTSINDSIMNDVHKELFHKTMSQDMVFYDGSTPNNLVSRCSWGLNEMMSPFQSSIKTVIQSGTSIIGGFIMCWTISYRLTLLGLSTLGPIAYLGMLFRHWYYDNLRQTWKMHREVNRLTSESFHNIKTIRSFSKEPSIIQHYKDLRDELYTNGLKASVMNSMTQTLMSWFHLAGGTLITWAGGIIVFLSLMNHDGKDGSSNNSESNFFLNDTLTLGQLMAFELYWNKFKGDIESLRRLIGSFEEAKFRAKHIFRTLDATPSIELIENDKIELNSNKKCDDIVGDICFNNVHFTYQLEPNKEILKGINLKIAKGKTTAFVGKSGGGKTTIISLLLRFYDATKGSITINDSKTGEIIDNIKNYNVYSWRNCIALVSQDTELFGSQTMAHNIGFGKEYYTKKELYYSSHLANAHEFIMSFDDKYDARIGDRGNKLSGGQKQRISIARMLMKKPKLMLLDEATSALDAESEAIVQAALEHAMKDTQCTVILVAHRLSTVVNADQICVIHDGTVAECGTHDELLEKNGVYAKLVDRQVNLRKTMKKKVKEMTDGNNNDENKSSNSNKNIDSIDALMDQISQMKEDSKIDKEEEDQKSGS